uniref:Tripartite motif-containing protein 2 n=1 Tax=Magallana gigas TaxID=29159 RepID=K1PS86_MAGGI|eukprot:XP_011428116.1 PREDICTED: tripartite motif-containing protein 2 [Crassostrea gigas]
MALSKPVIPDTVNDEPTIGQHYLVCGTEDCKKNCQFYCNDCHRSMCEQCRDEHQKSPDTKDHEVVPYRKRRRQLPVEKCKDHPTKDIDMICEDCQIPVCSKCVIQDHQKHTLNDLETIYSEKFTLCLDEIHKIHQYFLPTSHDIQEDTKENFKEIKATMDKIRTSIKAEAESIKRVVDTVASDEIEQVNKMEESLEEKLKSQENTYQDYISYLEELVREFHGYLSSTKVQSNPLILSLPDQLRIKPIPKTIIPIPPIFTAGQYSKENVTKLLGRITAPDTKPENRKIKPMETASTQLKPTEQHRTQDREKSEIKQKLSLSSYVTKVRQYTVPGVNSVCHISLGQSGRLWASDSEGNLVHTDLQGNQQQKIQTSSLDGYHTVTQDGDLIFTDRKNKVINKIKPENTITEFIKTTDWEPISIHSSHINGDILVGMVKDGEAKVTRYNKTGKERQKIQRDNKGQGLYSKPHYITENINGDICTSDYTKHAVLVVNKSGQHRFSYTGQRSEFCPYGICTDLHGLILVCSRPLSGMMIGKNTVNLLDQHGQFFLLIPTEQLGFYLGLCVDDENSLHVGQSNTNTVTVYKYLW